MGWSGGETTNNIVFGKDFYHGDIFVVLVDNFVVTAFMLISHEMSGFTISGGVVGDFCLA